MEIKNVWAVNGQQFDTQEEAQAYLDSNKNKARIEAFADYKRSQGAQRVNTSIIEEFLKFEEDGGEDLMEEPAPETEATAPEKEESAFTEPEASSEESEMEDVDGTEDHETSKSLFG